MAASSKPEQAASAATDPAALKAELDNLVAQATAKYAVKEYREAAELYSRGTELQSQLNGEMSTANADLLFLYGRCLYHVAVINSDVLGTKVAGDKVEQTNNDGGGGGASAGASAGASKSAASGNTTWAGKTEDRTTEELVAAAAQEKEAKDSAVDEGANKPFFQFTGDDNYDDSDEEGEGEGDAEDAEADAEPEDDFSNAFEVLDLARLLLERKLQALEEEGVKEDTTGAAGDKGKGKEIAATSASSNPEINRLKERLGDTYDLQAEISLENEQFPAAATDLRSALAIKKLLFPPESSILAEAHFKLSLALEFSSVTQQQQDGQGDGGAQPQQPATVDEAMREEAALQMEEAIASCQARIAKEEEILAKASSAGVEEKKSKITREGINDVKDMVKDMQQRLVELRQPPVSINDPTGTGAIDGATPLQGILGSILGESPEAQKVRLEEASKNATDLTGLVKRKKQQLNDDGGDAASTTSSAAGKRKAEDDVSEAESKKARVEDGSDE